MSTAKPQRTKGKPTQAVTVKATPVKGSDLKPGDLFSTAGADYWNGAMHCGSIGERVYIRTEEPCPPEQANENVYRILVLPLRAAIAKAKPS